MYLKKRYAGTVDERAPVVARLREIAATLATLRAKGVLVPFRPKRALTADEQQVVDLNAEAATLRDQIRVTGVRIDRAGRRQKFSPSWIEGGKREGWLTREGDIITIRGENVTVEYQIIAAPGLFCCHCEAPQGDEIAAREHVATEHAGLASPDVQNPSGYRQDNSYLCVLLGDEIDELTPEEAAEMARGIRDTLNEKLSAKFGDTRGAAERHRLAKAAARGQEG